MLPMQHKIQNINVTAHDWNQLRSIFTRLYHAPRGIKYFEVQTLLQQLHSQMPKQKQNPEIADGFWCSQMPKKIKIQKLQMDSGARHQSQKWTTGENTSNTIIIYSYQFL